MSEEPSFIAFEAVMRTHNQRLFRIARSILGDDAEAEDAVQAAYVAAFTKSEQFAGWSSLGTWLARITAHHALDRLRRRKREQRLGDVHRLVDEERRAGAVSARSPEESAAQQELRSILERAIDSLPEHLRLVLVMRDVEGMSGAMTADCLGIEEGAVRVRLHRARSHLRNRLGDGSHAPITEAFGFAGERCDRIVERTLAVLGAEAGNSQTRRQD